MLGNLDPTPGGAQVNGGYRPVVNPETERKAFRGRQAGHQDPCPHREGGEDDSKHLYHIGDHHGAENEAIYHKAAGPVQG
jgi:hypothetical protein